MNHLLFNIGPTHRHIPPNFYPSLPQNILLLCKFHHLLLLTLKISIKNISILTKTTMEFFLGFVFTITFSLIVSFFFAKVLSAATTDDPHPVHESTKKNKTAQSHHYPKFQEDCPDFNSETQTKLGFASKLGESTDDQVFILNNQTQRLQLFRAEEAEKNEGKLPDEVEKSEIDLGLKKDEVGMEEKEKEEIEIIKSDDDDDDDWEGIERSDLERVFGAAVAYVGSVSKISNFCSDLKLEFYGLHQVAIEGPCFVPQPMALKVSARAKWNAWQQLGKMSQEEAMEQYINLLSRTFPGWMEDTDTLAEDGKQDFTHNASMSILSDLNPALGNHQYDVAERSLAEQMLGDDDID